ncbi:MAG: type I-E CRISPR-associated protein Cas5/CasD [Candidatus Omnitrophica bacterium]|nr:type I-E CRISPR-associated protein Cas5/CasD [Candidatus Omnitrophota bacterium]
MLDIIEFEVEAPMALFSRVDSNNSFSQSYPIPTPTAVEGICTSIVGIHRERSTAMRAEYIKVCSPLKTDIFKTNSHAISRKDELVKSGNAQECRKVVLRDQRWIFGVRAVHVDGLRTEGEIILHQMFLRYIELGKQVKSPCCGHSEMMPSYIGKVRDSAKINTGFTMFIPDFLVRTYSSLIDGDFSPMYVDVLVEKGFLDYNKIRKDNNVF